MLVRHFERAETDWRVVAPVRNMVRFKSLNLAESFDVPQMDVVFLRNVLIYFDSATKSQVLQRVRRVLRPDGYLFLGGAETTLGLDDGFDRVSAGTCTVYRHRGAGPVQLPARPCPGGRRRGLAGASARPLNPLAMDAGRLGSPARSAGGSGQALN